MIRLVLAIAMVVIAPNMVASSSSDRALSDAAWRLDIAQMSRAIKETHFKPFANLQEAEFDAAVGELNEAVSEMSDHQIILELARILALLRDGHTRVHIPRQYPQFALEAELGHSGTPPPHDDRLKFRQLPVQFGLFSDGLFVIGSSPEHAALIGREVVCIGNLTDEEGIEAVREVSFFENDSRARMMAPDRLALVEVLAGIKAIDQPGPVPLCIPDDGEKPQTVILEPLTGELDEWIDGQPSSPPRWTRHIEQDEWFEVAPESDAIYVQVNRFSENPRRPYAEFVAETLSAARAAGVRKYVVDLRHNSGGIGAWTIPFTTGLTRSEYNRYGRLFILMGGTTFSAAQHFLHEFEELSYAIFVGEPSGAKPSHYGDAKRVVLENSGLTVRVSTIYWHSWLANDFRDAIEPHLEAPPGSADYFSGRDPAWQAAVDYQASDSIAEQIGEQLRKGNIQNGLLLYQRYQTDATFSGLRSNIPALMTMADSLVEDGLTRPGMYVYLLLNQTFPGMPGVEAGLQRVQALLESDE